MVCDANPHSRTVRMLKEMMTTGDMVDGEAGPLQRAYELTRFHRRQSGHTASRATATVSLMMGREVLSSSGGAGKPSFARLSR